MLVQIDTHISSVRIHWNQSVISRQSASRQKKKKRVLENECALNAEVISIDSIGVLLHRHQDETLLRLLLLRRFLQMVMMLLMLLPLLLLNFVLEAAAKHDSSGQGLLICMCTRAQTETRTGTPVPPFSCSVDHRDQSFLVVVVIAVNTAVWVVRSFSLHRRWPSAD